MDTRAARVRKVAAMLYQQIDRELELERAWTLRRQLGIPNNRRLFVLACMDERLPVEEALGLRPGDAHVFRKPFFTIFSKPFVFSILR